MLSKIIPSHLNSYDAPDAHFTYSFVSLTVGRIGRSKSLLFSYKNALYDGITEFPGDAVAIAR